MCIECFFTPAEAVNAYICLLFGFPFPILLLHQALLIVFTIGVCHSFEGIYSFYWINTFMDENENKAEFCSKCSKYSKFKTWKFSTSTLKVILPPLKVITGPTMVWSQTCCLFVGVDLPIRGYAVIQTCSYHREFSVAFSKVILWEQIEENCALYYRDRRLWISGCRDLMMS